MNPSRVEYIRQKLLNSNEPEWTFETRHDNVREQGTGKWLKGKKVLDVGCGGGLLAESLARLGGDVLAIDAGRENIEIARIHAEGDPFLPIGDRAKGGEKLEYRWIAAEKLKEEGRKFDVVTSMEVIEHVDEPGEFLKCLGDMVKVSLFSGPLPSLPMSWSQSVQSEHLVPNRDSTELTPSPEATLSSRQYHERPYPNSSPSPSLKMF